MGNSADSSCAATFTPNDLDLVTHCHNWVSISSSNTITFSPKNVVDCGTKSFKLGRKVLGGLETTLGPTGGILDIV
jgi:hypothetical protein